MAIQNIVGEWLMRKGKKIAPKTFLQQILLPNGSKFEDEYNENKSNVETRLGDIDTAIGEIKPDWNENDPNSPAYIKNRIGYIKRQEKVLIIDNIEVTTPITDGIGGMPTFKIPGLKESMEPDQVYEVIFDGKVYILKAKGSAENGSAFNPCVGNTSLIDASLTDTKEPFVINFVDVLFSCLFIKSSVDGKHTVTINKVVDIYEPIPECYFPTNIKNKTGLNVEGKEFTYELDGQSVTAVAGQGAEIFNDYDFNIAIGKISHAEGSASKAIGNCSHAEGSSTEAIGVDSHAEGQVTKAIGKISHAEGSFSKSIGTYSHAEGSSTEAIGVDSHAEGCNTIATAEASHAEGCNTIATAEASHVEGKYNVEDTEKKYAHIVGNGESTKVRSNAHTVDWQGNGWYQGSVESSSAILRSSTPESTKRFRITVDDTGTLKAEEIV